LTDGIERRILATRECALAAAGSLKGFVDQERTRNEECRRNAETALQVLYSVHERARGSVAMMAEESGRLGEEISRAIVSLQFQDRFSQRVAHVAEALQEIETVLGGGASQSMLLSVENAYTMREEREVQKRLAGAAATDSIGENDMDVELF
jgi:hypothetical protein